MGPACLPTCLLIIKLLHIFLQKWYVSKAIDIG